MNNFDTTLNLNVGEIEKIEKELKSIGFKKFKKGDSSFVFKGNKKYPSISIEKSFSYDNKLEYDLRVNDDWETEPVLSLQFNTERNKVSSIEDFRKTIYSKFFNNEIRKQKVKKLLNPDVDLES